MGDYYHQLDGIPVHKVAVGDLRMLSGKQGTVFWLKTTPGTQTPEHFHPMEQTSWLVSGTMEVKIGDDPRRRIAPGTAVLIPGGVRHQFWYLDECTIVEFAAPPRLDWFPDAALYPYGIAPGTKPKDQEAAMQFPPSS